MLLDEAYNLTANTDMDGGQSKIWSTKQYFNVPHLSASRADADVQLL